MKIGKSHPLTLWRKENRLPMQELADKLDCTQSFLSQIETGKRQPSLGMAAKLSRETGIPMEAFAKQVEAAQ
jgi:transcriptional regulator with XRE-family HTH domain